MSVAKNVQSTNEIKKKPQIHENIVEFEKFTNLLLNICYIVGLAFIIKKFKLSFPTILITLVAFSYTYATFLQINQAKSTIASALRMLMPLSIAFQLMIKLVNTFLLSDNYRKIYENIRQIHLQNGHHLKKQQYLLKILKITNNIFRCTFVLYNISGASILISTLPSVIVSFKNTNVTKEYLLPATFPYFKNYWFNCFYHTYCIFAVSLGFCVFDNFLLIKLVHYYANGLMIKFSLDDLEEIMEGKGKTDVLIDSKLREIYDTHIRMIK